MLTLVHPEAVDTFTYLGSIISNSLSLEIEVSIRTAKTAAVTAEHTWYQAYIFATLLYGTESWSE